VGRQRSELAFQWDLDVSVPNYSGLNRDVQEESGRVEGGQ
jgi:hypothetical protein